MTGNMNGNILCMTNLHKGVLDSPHREFSTGWVRIYQEICFASYFRYGKNRQAKAGALMRTPLSFDNV